MADLLRRAANKLTVDVKEDLSPRVTAFLQRYYYCEAAAKAMLKAYRHTQTRKEIARALNRHIGKTLDESRVLKIVNSINADRIKSFSEFMNLNITELKRALRPYDLVDDALLDTIFQTAPLYRRKGKKSCRILRNELVHGIKPRAVYEVESRYDALMTSMETFLNALPN